MLLCIIFILNCRKSSYPNSSLFIEQFPFKEYNLDNNGNLLFSEINRIDFQNSSDCETCHPSHYEEWNNSSHSNSSSNLFFNHRRNEVIEEHGDNTGRFCDQCHDPIGIISNGNGENIYEERGVTCDVCHTMTRVSSPTIAQPHEIVTSKLFLNPGQGIKYGSIENPQGNTYHDSQYNTIFNQSESCLPCHDLRHEQLETEVTFTEWSRIPGMAMSGAFSCQQCHMPKKEDGTHEHHFVGVDLSYTVLPEEDPLYPKVLNLINKSAEISFESNENIELDTINWNALLNIPIRIESKTGHHLPSGTSFNRECWLSVEVKEHNEDGNIIFKNGVLDSNTQQLNYLESQLIFFTSFLITADGDTTQDNLKAKEIINYSLPGMNIKYTNYEFKLNSQLDSIWINAKLNFRPIKPFIFDNLPNLKNNIPIYTIDEIEKTIHIIN